MKEATGFDRRGTDPIIQSSNSKPGGEIVAEESKERGKQGKYDLALTIILLIH